MKNVAIVVLSILLLGCKGKQEPPPAKQETAPAAPAPAAPTPTTGLPDPHAPPPADAPPGCIEASKHVMDLWSASPEMQKASPEDRKIAEGMMLNLQSEIVKECAAKQWTSAQIDCVKLTEKLEDLAKCEIKKQP